MFSLRRNDPLANDKAMRVVRGGPKTQTRVYNFVEISRVGKVALEDTDRVVYPVAVLTRADVPERAVPNEHV